MERHHRKRVAAPAGGQIPSTAAFAEFLTKSKKRCYIFGGTLRRELIQLLSTFGSPPEHGGRQ
jgi:hypothetical protein